MIVEAVLTLEGESLALVERGRGRIPLNQYIARCTLLGAHYFMRQTAGQASLLRGRVARGIMYGQMRAVIGAVTPLPPPLEQCEHRLLLSLEYSQAEWEAVECVLPDDTTLGEVAAPYAVACAIVDVDLPNGVEGDDLEISGQSAVVAHQHYSSTLYATGSWHSCQLIRGSPYPPRGV